MQIGQLAGAVTGLDGPDEQGRVLAASLRAGQGFNTAVANLWQAWATEPTTPGAAVALVDRGVANDLVLETEADSKGELRQDAADAFEAPHGITTFWVWPAKARPEQGAVLHAKAAIRDTSAALVTSANFTGRALERNMELGLLVTGGPVPRRLAEHFDALMAGGVLSPVAALG